MLFGSDWLANMYMGLFLFGLIVTVISLFFSVDHLGATHAGWLHGPHLHSVAHGPHLHSASGHQGAGTHGGGVHHLPNLAEQIDGLSPINMPTVMAFLTWFGAAGYLLRTVLGLGFLPSFVLALISGLAGGSLLFLILSRLLWAGQTVPMRRADYYLPGTQARVVSSIAAGGTGEVVFQKSGYRRVEGARSMKGESIPKGTLVQIMQYDKGLAYVDPVTTTSDIPPPSRARMASRLDANTQPLNGTAGFRTDDWQEKP